MPEPKTLILPAVTAQKSGRVVEIEYRASIDLAEADVIPAMLRSASAIQPGRIIAVRLRWYWTGANPPESTAGITAAEPRKPHWTFDRYNSRIVAQRRTAKTAATETSWGTPLTRTIESIEGAMGLLEPLIVAHAPADEPVVTWMHRDR